MCLFTFPNKNSIKARLKGIEKFECGSCPECLQKKSRLWALRCCMEAKVNVGMMITLTYDTYKNGVDGEENPVDSSIIVNKKHCQDFIKRLRYYFPDKNIKYLLSAEYGKRTHRAHYHALIFGVQFDDLRFCKKSKRGNIIYRSKTLEKIWSHGICSVDAINLSAKIARYCTKYCAKDSGVDDTFMLFSRGIGDSELLRLFNGKSYWIDGREYSIPRQIWQKFIEKKYSLAGFSRYVGKNHFYDNGKKLCNSLDKLEKREKELLKKKSFIKRMIYNHNRLLPYKRGFRSAKTKEIWNSRADMLLEKLAEVNQAIFALLKEREKVFDIACSKADNERKYERSKNRREIFQAYRDNDYLYKRYLAYWKEKNRVCEIIRPDEFTRILALPENKYRSYRAKAILAKNMQFKKLDFVPPRSNIQAFLEFPVKREYQERAFAPLTRHYRANDSRIISKMKLFGIDPGFLIDCDTGEVEKIYPIAKKIQKI